METLIRIQRVRKTLFDSVSGTMREFKMSEIAKLVPNGYVWGNQPHTHTLTFNTTSGTTRYGDVPSGANVDWTTYSEPNFTSSTKNIAATFDARGYLFSQYKDEQPPVFTVSGDIEWWDRTQHSGGLDDDDHACVKT